MGGRAVGAKTERYRSRLVRGADGIYSISVKVPAELKPRLQAEDLRLSLNTTDLEEAACIQPFMAHDLSEALEKVAREIRLEAFDAAEDFIQMDRIGGAFVEQSADVIIGKILAACASPKQIHYEAAYAPTTAAARELLRAVDQLVSDFNIPVGRYSVNFWKLVGRIDRLRHGASPDRFQVHNDRRRTDHRAAKERPIAPGGDRIL